MFINFCISIIAIFLTNVSNCKLLKFIKKSDIISLKKGVKNGSKNS